MVKLTAAKCPTCGASIEVNKDLKNAICMYCGNQILIEEAIQKMEIAGKVEVEGIKGRTSKLEQAKKHIAIEEYKQAKDILNELIKDDKFDIEAYCELIKVNIEFLSKRDFNENSSSRTDRDSWVLFNSIISDYDRVKKIDKEESYKELLSDYKDKLDYYEKLSERVNSEEEELKEQVKVLNEYLKKISSLGLIKS